MRNTLHVASGGHEDNILLNIPNVTNIPIEGDPIEIGGSIAIVKRRADYQTTRGNLSVMLDPERQWQVNELLRFFRGHKEHS